MNFFTSYRTSTRNTKMSKPLSISSLRNHPDVNRVTFPKFPVGLATVFSHDFLQMLAFHQRGTLEAYLIVTWRRYRREEDRDEKNKIRNEFCKDLILKAFVDVGWIERIGRNRFVWREDTEWIVSPNVGITTKNNSAMIELMGLTMPIED